MKLKRIALIIVLIIYSVLCFQLMNTRYNPLARYQYATKENRDIIIEHMNQDDIDYLIQQKIKPEQFMDFIELEGFEAKSILYYDVCKKTEDIDRKYIIYFVNKYKNNFKLKDLESLIENYGYVLLEAFFSGMYPYMEDVKLIVNPSLVGTKIGENETVYKYTPNDLISVDTSIMPYVTGDADSIYIKQEMVEDLKNMCSALEMENQKTSGGLILTGGYVSYEDQIKKYEEALLTYGIDQVLEYEKIPGTNEKQLGYTITLTLAGMDETQMLESEEMKWLKENSLSYGFEMVEENTLTLRYVGKSTME